MQNKIFFLSALSVIASTRTDAQLISQFDWEANPPITATVGPNGSSISSSATVDVNGAGGTKGLNAGLPKEDIELKIPGAVFEVDGIDASIDFQRDENTGWFMRKGSSLRFGESGGKLRIRYRVDDGAGGYNEINATNIYNIPNDNTFRTYRFNYDAATGVGEVFVDGVSQWSNSGAVNRIMYWSGSGDFKIGDDLDGTGYNRTFLDNFNYSEVAFVPLPIELEYFKAANDNTRVRTYWRTASETNNEFFTIERSTNGLTFDEIGTVQGAGNSNATIDYDWFDENPYYGVSYYRLKQTDYDGAFEYSDIVALQRDEVVADRGGCKVQVRPNPCPGNCDVVLTDCPQADQNITLDVFDAAGNKIKTTIPSSSSDGNFTFHMDMDNNLAPGIYIVKATDLKASYSGKMMLNK